MKLVLLFLAGWLAITTSVFGQGMVTFANTSRTLIQTNDLITGNIGPISGTNGAYKIELLVAPYGTLVGPASGDLGPWSILKTATNSPSLPGRFFGGTLTNTLTTRGGPMAVYVRAWLSRSPSETSFDDSSYRGGSTILQLAVSGSPFPPDPPPPVIFGAGLLQGFDLFEVPEPSPVVLGLLGVCALALFRRRK